MTVIHVPLPRTLHLGQTGKDVAAMQGALKRAKVRPYKATGTFAVPTQHQVKVFQGKKGIPQTGLYGPNTHEALILYMDEYERYLFNEVNETLHPPMRQRIVKAAYAGYNVRNTSHYTQTAKRMSGVRGKIVPPKMGPYEDCSSFVTWCYWAGGGPDPNGFDFNGYGNTGTMWPHGHAVSRAQIRLADLVFYRWENGEPGHVAIYVGNGMVVSDGSESGPLYEKIDYRGDRIGIRSYLP